MNFSNAALSTSGRRLPFLLHPRVRYLTLALLLHAAFCYALYQIGPAKQIVRQQQRELASSARFSTQVKAQQRVKDLAQIKQLLEESRAPAKPTTGEKPPASEVDFSATSLPEAPRTLLKQARELSKSIKELDQETKAEELARLLKISKEEARAQVADKSAPEPAPAAAPIPAEPDKAAKADKTDTAQVAAEIAKLETEARAALQRRQAQLEREDSAPAGAAAKGSAQQAGAGGNGKSDPGASGSGSGGTAGNGKGNGAGEGGEGRSMAQRMAAFANRDIAHPRASKSYSWGSGGVFDSSHFDMPQLPASDSTHGRGRMFGAGGEYAARVYLNTWYVIGPFEGRSGSGLFDTAVYPPEQRVLLDAVYRGKGDRLLKWRYVSSPSYPFMPPDIDDAAVYYGYTEVMSDRAQDVTMWVGADDDAKVWVNDKVVWAKGNYAKQPFFDLFYNRANRMASDYNISEGTVPVHLNQGRNKFFFKLSNGPDRIFISVVLTK